MTTHKELVERAQQIADKTGHPRYVNHTSLGWRIELLQKQGIAHMFTKKRIEIMRHVKQAIRSPYAWPGGYPIYLIMDDGEALSITSAKENYKSIAYDTLNGYRSGWRVVDTDINWEDPALYCCHSGERIESAYAEDAANERVGL